jgi:hypothetical protein
MVFLASPKKLNSGAADADSALRQNVTIVRTRSFPALVRSTMPQTRDIALEELTGETSALVMTETRVDAAHSIGDAVSLPPRAEVALAEMPVEQAINELVRVEGAVQLQSQADQLAVHLRDRQQQLDRRESQVNARVADFEQEIREARAWLAQRNDELNEREAALNARDAALRSREEVAETRSGEGSGPKETRHRAVSPAVPGPASSFCLDAASDPMFQHAERELAKRQSGAASFDQRQWEAEWEERKQALARESEQLDQRRRALEEFRDEISQMHRDALELHLLAEDLRAQLRSSLGVEVAEQALEAARERMARRYQSDAAQLMRRREELEWLRSDLAREHAKLERRYEELKGWIQSQRG